MAQVLVRAKKGEGVGDGVLLRQCKRPVQRCVWQLFLSKEKWIREKWWFYSLMCFHCLLLQLPLALVDCVCRKFWGIFISPRFVPTVPWSTISMRFLAIVGTYWLVANNVVLFRMRLANQSNYHCRLSPRWAHNAVFAFCLIRSYLFYLFIAY